MSKYDIYKNTYGRLTIIHKYFCKHRKRNVLICECACGEYIITEMHKLTVGHTRSCGYLQRELLANRNMTHGMSKTKVYEVWKDIKKRKAVSIPILNNKTRHHYDYK